MDLLCMRPSKYMAISSTLLLAAGSAGILLNWLPERIGRKKTIVITQFFSTVFQFICLFNSNYWIRLVSFAFIGMLLIKNGVCYTYAFELVPQKSRPLVNSAINCFDTSTLMCICFYVLFINKYYMYSMELYVILGMIAWVILVLFVPESPKWFMI